VFVVVQTAVFRRLEQAHHEAWCAMGKPTLLSFRLNLQARRAMRDLMFGGAYRELGDERLNALVWATRGVIALSVVLFLLSAGLSVAAHGAR
jgi:hypothetical protein